MFQVVREDTDGKSNQDPAFVPWLDELNHEVVVTPEGIHEVEIPRFIPRVYWPEDDDSCSDDSQTS